MLKTEMFGRLFIRPSYNENVAFQATFSNMVKGETKLETFIISPEGKDFSLKAYRNDVIEPINYEVSYNEDRYNLSIRFSKEELERGSLLLKASIDNQRCEARLHFNRLVKPSAPEKFINSFSVNNVNYRFYIDNPMDEIQGRFHAKGRIYEQEILDYIKPMLPVHPIILDIGANVGNHAVYMDKTFEPEEILVFEANEKTVELLKANLALNACQTVNCMYIGRCVSDTHANYIKELEHNNNLGATSFIESDNQECNSIWPDEDISFTQLDFIKIDVEGMELRALSGLEKTIRRFNPIILIESNLKTNSRVLEWLDRHGYIIDRAFHPYPDNWMYLTYCNN